MGRGAASEQPPVSTRSAWLKRGRVRGKLARRTDTSDRVIISGRSLAPSIKGLNSLPSAIDPRQEALSIVKYAYFLEEGAVESRLRSLKFPQSNPMMLSSAANRFPIDEMLRSVFSLKPEDEAVDIAVEVWSAAANGVLDALVDATGDPGYWEKLLGSARPSNYRSADEKMRPIRTAIFGSNPLKPSQYAIGLAKRADARRRFFTDILYSDSGSRRWEDDLADLFAESKGVRRFQGSSIRSLAAPEFLADA